ncbi:MAG: TolC family protein [Desulfobacteraceae bacterium]|jgi:NodT family efflux transporter outer membrane factor (OMF) lipoprotein
MQALTRLHRFFLLTLTLFFCGCAAGGHQDFAALADREREQFQEGIGMEGERQAAILNHLIRSTDLEALVDEALAANPGLQQTLLTLRIRQGQYRQTSGERWPEITAGYAADRKEGSDTSYAGSISIGWEIDLWSKLADDIRAAAKDMAEQQALYQSARDSLTAQVMKTWLGLTAAHKNVTIELERLATFENTETFILQRYRSGLCTLADLDSAQSATAASRVTLEGYREILAQQKRVLKNLLGRKPGMEITAPEEYATVLVPLAELPAQTLQRRPDLKAAYLAIEAATLRARVAYKELLPLINLQAALEDVASSPAQALLTDPVWSLLARLTAPLFQGGKLRAAAQIAELKTARSYQAYRETLYRAVQEIKDTIGLEHSITRQLGHMETALAKAQNNLHQYQRRYRTGLVEILDLLAVQRQAYDLEIQRNNLVYKRLANRVNLGLALGLGVKQ